MDGLQQSNQNLYWIIAHYALTVGIPRGRNFPGWPGLGISLRRHGLGLYRPALSSARKLVRKASLPWPLRILVTVIPSIPAVRLPLFEAILRQAHRKLRASITQFHNSR